MTHSDIWAISAYYNLSRWNSRPRNYRAFRRELSIPLLTVEWNPGGHFELGHYDADKLIQIGGGGVMWQKERLLGIALSALPDHVRYVVWIDGDVIFDDPLWYVRTRESLQHNSVIQPFNSVAYLDRDTTIAVQNSGRAVRYPVDVSQAVKRQSFMSLYRTVGDRIARVDLDHRFSNSKSNGVPYPIHERPAYGHVWAARVDVLRQIGLYERCVFGGGDLLFGYGIVGKGEDLIANHQSVGWGFYGDCATYRSWFQNAASVCDGRLGVLDGTLLHLFHGSLEDRQYKSRIDGLIRYDLDLDSDIVAIGEAPWSWSDARPDLEKYFLTYLQGRNEDRSSG